MGVPWEREEAARRAQLCELSLVRLESQQQVRQAVLCGALDWREGAGAVAWTERVARGNGSCPLRNVIRIAALSRCVHCHSIVAQFRCLARLPVLQSQEIPRELCTG